MLTNIVIALAAALVFGAATAAVAIVNYKAYASLAALDPHSERAVVYAQNWAAGCDTSGAANLRGQLTRICTLSLNQQLRC